MSPVFKLCKFTIDAFVYYDKVKLFPIEKPISQVVTGQICPGFVIRCNRLESIEVPWYISSFLGNNDNTIMI